MKIATWNINGLISRLSQVIEWSAENRPDILCLQETKCIDAKFPAQRLRSAGFTDFAFTGEKSYNGVAILSRLPLENIEFSLPGNDSDLATRFVTVTVGGITLVNVYVPHGTKVGSDKFAFKLAWMARVRKYFDDRFATDEKVILCGDLNVAPHEMDVWNPRQQQDKTHFSKPEREALLNVKKWGFVDVFRQFNDEPGEYSWWSHFHHDFEKNRGLRIDHIWTSPPMAESCIDCWVDKTTRANEKPSDHAPVIAEFAN